MKNIQLLITAAFFIFTGTGCSYVSDMVEGAITNRASFSAEAYQSGSAVIISWDETDNSSDFIGIEIYRTKRANDEFSGYVTVADRFIPPNSGDLTDGNTTTCTVDIPSADGALPAGTTGVYFYRIAFIHWDDPADERTADNGYSGTFSTDYDSHTSIDSVSGSAMVDIN